MRYRAGDGFTPGPSFFLYAVVKEQDLFSARRAF